MNWIVNIVVGVIMLIAGFFLDRLWEWSKKRKAGFTGQAHIIISKLGRSVQSFEGYYFLSNTPTDNFKITKHVYEHASGEVIGTCFRENPTCYGQQDLARLLPTGASFVRLTTDQVCTALERDSAETVLQALVPDGKIVMVPSNDRFTNIDGIYTAFPDGTHIAFVTFPKTAPEHKNRGIVFYGHIARAFFEYYRDLTNASTTTNQPAPGEG